MRYLFLLLIFFPKSSGMDVLNEYTSPVLEDRVSTHSETVTLTTYTPIFGETDSTPNITASGFKIDVDNPEKHRIIAVSRDLKRKGWKFNKKVRIKGAGKYNGVYTIKDIMNKRHRKRIDILVREDTKPVKLSNVKITLIN